MSSWLAITAAALLESIFVIHDFTDPLTATGKTGGVTWKVVLKTLNSKKRQVLGIQRIYVVKKSINYMFFRATNSQVPPLL
ncbi:MAG: hypothetical protein KBT66_02575 [Amphritea sp.]|nr:hypothetical protein [Amphritea sp.]